MHSSDLDCCFAASFASFVNKAQTRITLSMMFKAFVGPS